MPSRELSLNRFASFRKVKYRRLIRSFRASCVFMFTCYCFGHNSRGGIGYLLFSLALGPIPLDDPGAIVNLCRKFGHAGDPRTTEVSGRIAIVHDSKNHHRAPASHESRGLTRTSPCAGGDTSWDRPGLGFVHPLVW